MRPLIVVCGVCKRDFEVKTVQPTLGDEAVWVECPHCQGQMRWSIRDFKKLLETRSLGEEKT